MRGCNVLFSVLAQFFEPEAINDRLILIETLSFTTSPDDMMKALTRIIADRSDGALFFGNYYMMDYELMGGRCPGRHHRRERQARTQTIPAACGAIRLQTVADADHAGAGTRFPRRPAVNGAGA